MSVASSLSYGGNPMIVSEVSRGVPAQGSSARIDCSDPNGSKFTIVEWQPNGPTDSIQLTSGESATAVHSALQNSTIAEFQQASFTVTGT